jgi:hypothetical protein
MTWQAESFVPFGSLCLPLPVLSPSSLMINPIRKLEYAATKERPPHRPTASNLPHASKLEHSVAKSHRERQPRRGRQPPLFVRRQLAGCFG